MRKLYLWSTVVFWILVTGFWLGGILQPGAVAEVAAPSTKAYSLQDVARHATPGDCWMAIHGNVYDLTTYLPDHPSRPSIIEPWCGKEATDAYATKTKGRAHSEAADKQLETYLIGTVVGPNAP